MKIPRSANTGRPLLQVVPTCLTWQRGDVVDLWVPHIAAPQGSHRQGFGKSVKETNPRTEPYRQAVADSCETFKELYDEWTPLDGPLGISLVFYMPPAPKSDAKRPYPHVAPDLDKMVRSTFDGISRGGIWKDDARVVELAAKKVHATSLPRTGVDARIWEVL